MRLQVTIDYDESSTTWAQLAAELRATANMVESGGPNLWPTASVESGRTPNGITTSTRHYLPNVKTPDLFT